jgi:hypothetical protein
MFQQEIYLFDIFCREATATKTIPDRVPQLFIGAFSEYWVAAGGQDSAA